MKIVFMGSSTFAIPSLRILKKAQYDIKAVYSQPPRKAGRGKSYKEVPLAEFALSEGLKLEQPTTFKDPNIIYLTNVKAEIRLNQSDNIVIISDFGKYNTDNFDTIFSKNVIIKYLKNKIVSEYLDFSMNRNTMIISRNVIFTNPENILRADVIEMDLKTKDNKIIM